MKTKLIPYLEKKADTKVFLFSDKIYTPEDSMKMNRGTTMIGNVLKEVSKTGKSTPQALFLISDGRNTAGEEPLGIADKLPFPVFSIKVGKITKKNNIGLESIRVNPIVYKEDSVPVTIIISNSGKERRNVTVYIKKNGRVLDKKRIPLLDIGTEHTTRLIFVPEKAGVENFEIEIGSYEGEENLQDNKRNFAVKVLKKRKTVVLLAYQLNWDYRFLMDFLKSQKDIEPIGFAKMGSNIFLVQNNDEKRKGKLDYEKIVHSDILILINPEAIDQKLFSSITGSIAKNGMGLLIIGNKIPDFSEFRNLYPFVVSGNCLTGDFEPSVTQFGFTSPLFKVNGYFPLLPPLSNPLHIKMVKASTEVYLEAKKSGSSNIPLFGSIMYGKGKIAAFTGENIWHWKMFPTVTEEKKGIYDVLMNNILKWLTIRKDEERIVLSMERTKLLWGEPVTISATLYDEMMKPVEGGIIALHLKKENEIIKDFLMDDVEMGNYEKTIGMLKPGTYSLQADVKFPEGLRTKPSLHFEITKQEIENLNTEPDSLLLNNISEASGGKLLSHKNISEELKRIQLKPIILSTQKKLMFGNNLFILLLISFIFFLEIFLRKTRGLK